MSYKQMSLVSLILAGVAGAAAFFVPQFVLGAVAALLLGGAFHAVQGRFQAGYHYGAVLLLYFVHILISHQSPTALSWIAGSVGLVAIGLQVIEHLYPNGIKSVK